VAQIPQITAKWAKSQQQGRGFVLSFLVATKDCGLGDGPFKRGWNVGEKFTC
jgi:hypothetical protein